jgi:micrococcal nuclease
MNLFAPHQAHRHQPPIPEHRSAPDPEYRPLQFRSAPAAPTWHSPQEPLRQVVEQTGQRILKGHCWVIDGDTIVINKTHIRLSGIDAPELDHPYGQNAKRALMQLCKGQVVTAITDGSTSHERVVAMCHLEDGRDLSAEMVKAGFALDWAKHSGGKYRHLEAEGLRKKLWRADARQKGRMPPSVKKGQ